MHLRRLLGLPKYAVWGVCEGIWAFAAKYARGGDIGKFADEQIAEFLGYEGDAQELVAALIASGLLDQHHDHRLVVHDWAEHVDQYVHRAVARRRERFVDGTAPKLGKMDAAERSAAAQFYSGDAHGGPRGEPSGSPRAVHGVRSQSQSQSQRRKKPITHDDFDVLRSDHSFWVSLGEKFTPTASPLAAGAWAEATIDELLAHSEDRSRPYTSIRRALYAWAKRATPAEVERALAKTARRQQAARPVEPDPDPRSVDEMFDEFQRSQEETTP